MGKITVLGMGPGDIGYLTLRTWEIMKSAGVLLLRIVLEYTFSFLLYRISGSVVLAEIMLPQLIYSMVFVMPVYWLTERYHARFSELLDD